MNTIFLDIDGVLNDLNTEENIGGIIGIDDSKLFQLSKIISETNSIVVLTSSWRIGYCKNPKTKMGQYLEEKLSKYSIQICDVVGSNDRGFEIKKYITDHNIENYIVIDDEIFPDFDDEIISHLCKCNFYENGLTEEIANKCINLLQHH